MKHVVDEAAGWVSTGLPPLDSETLAPIRQLLAELQAKLGALPGHLSASEAARAVSEAAASASAALESALRAVPGAGGAGAAASDAARSASAAFGEAVKSLPGVGGDLAGDVGAAVGAVGAALAKAQTEGIGGYDLGTLALISAVVAVAAACSVPKNGLDPSRDLAGGGDALPEDWDPLAVAEYFQHRPVFVANRAATVAYAAAQFGAALLLDMAQGMLSEVSCSNQAFYWAF